MEMTTDQLRAEKAYLASATFENSFKPMSLALLAKEVDSSTSTLGRWKIKFEWDKKLELIVSASSIKDGEAKELIDATSFNENVKKILDDFSANEKVKSKSYAILLQSLEHFANEMRDGATLSLDKLKVVTKMLEITATREDKLLDRQALLSATKLTNSGDTLKALRETPIDVEIED